MEAIDHTIGIIGGGNMGEAFAGALINTGLAPAERIRIVDVDERRRCALAEKYGVQTGTDARALYLDSDILILAVKPQQMAAVLRALTPGDGHAPSSRKLIVSIAAGIRLETFERFLYAGLPAAAQALLPIIRVMPNTPALVLAGMSGMSANRMATDEDRALTRRLLESMGRVMEFAEADLDAVTALSGSGPAYVFYLAEAMTRGGVLSGLPREDAAALTLQTLVGAVRLMAEEGQPPEVLRARVTSPGGTTAAAVAHMEAHGVKDHIAEAIAAATRRAEELSRAAAAAETPAAP